MAYKTDDLVKDQACNYLKNNATRLALCAGSPADFSEANTALGSGSGKKLGDVTVDSSDFTTQDGPTDGRECNCAAQSVTIATAGNADHVAWLDVANSRLLHVTQLSGTLSGLTVSQVVAVPEHAYILRDTIAAT